MLEAAFSARAAVAEAELMAGPPPEPVVPPTQSSRFELCLDPCGQPFVRRRPPKEEARMSAESIKPGSRVTIEATALREGRDGALFVRIGEDAFASVPRASVRSVEPPPVKIGDHFHIGALTMVVEATGIEFDRSGQRVEVASGDLFDADGKRVGALTLRRDWLAGQARL